MRLHDLTAVYSCSEKLERDGVKISPVSFPELEEFNAARLILENEIKSHELEGAWEVLLSELTIYHAKVARTPCSPKWLYSQYGIRTKLKGIEIPLRAQLQHVDSDVGEAFSFATKTLATLKDLERNPIAEKCIEALESCQGRTIVVLRDKGLREEALLSLIGHGPHLKEITIKRPVEIRNHEAVDTIFLFGPPSILDFRGEGFLIRSPIAEHVEIVYAEHEYCPPFKTSLIRGCGNTITIRNRPNLSRNDLLYEAELLTPKIKGPMGFRLQPKEGQLIADEYVESDAVQLGGEKFVFLNPESSVFTASLRQKNGCAKCTSVHRTDVQDLEPGELVILNKNGSSDLVQSFADELLGDKARLYRRFQNDWKNTLTNFVHEHGLEKTAIEAKRAGCKSASITNIKNWCHHEAIGPMYTDLSFQCLLRVLGIEAQYEKISEAINKLRIAHRSAGMSLAKDLIKSIRGQDLTTALATGLQDVGFVEGGPTKTIFFVERISRSVTVPSSQIGKVVDMHEIL